ncbi:polysaccharide deacetylase family protein [Sphingomonas sp. 28-63-12]|uniref:polysaccharide deacetylase family protein n=1 Tax=Sphingomonas sp. 28-63-12 TaxID=1970434 RepID=UPI000BCCAEED|nr:MAG: WalW protein [Sphingomonas sp. 28-63-12]
MPDREPPANRAGSYRPPAPAPADLIAWPADFGTRFTVFVDTEEEFDWNAPLSRDSRATTAVQALPSAQARFAAAGVPLNFMIDHPIVSDPAAVDILRTILAQGNATIGTQLHPWVNPPFDEAVTPYNSFPGNLPPALEAAKLDVLTTAIAGAFGTPPIAYRAGRYGIGPQTIGLLAARGYRIDSSMRSRYDYGGEGGPDFAAIGNAPFRVSGMIELPLTTIFTGLLRRAGQPLYGRLGKLPRGRGLFARTGLLARVALTPEEMPIADALEAVRIALGEGAPLLNFSFHSPSLVPGHTPYVRDLADLAAFDCWWDRMLALLDSCGARPIALTDLVATAG